MLQRLMDACAGLWTIVHPGHPGGAYRHAHFAVLFAIFAGAVFVRFWGLGSVGLHGDEETMAMAVRGILRDGTPHLPSGMLYPRGLAQLYMMAASVLMFGETEWALRLPSALCGLVPIGFAFLVGRRFLRPEWNLAFTAAVAFLPEFIVYSQTARMYIFLVASVAALMWLVLEWERTGRPRFLLAAVAVMLIGIHFHALMLFSAPLLLFPPLLRGDSRRLGQAIAALVAIAIGFRLIDGWIEQQYTGLPEMEVTSKWVILPSVWPFLKASVFSRIAAAIVAAGCIVALWRLARRSRIGDYWLLLVLGSLIPLMAIGVIRWNVPPRYTAGAVLPYLLCAFAVLQSFSGWFMARRGLQPGRFATVAAAALGCVLIVNPVAFARTVNSGYATHPDHKGAAEFVRSLNLGPGDVVLAEDVLQQTYYLGSVDYWLIGWNTARYFVRDAGGRPLDIYTGTPVMKSAAEVAALLERTKGNVYVVGSGENRSDGRRLMRSDGLFEFLQSDRVQTLYEGRDGFTRVWKVCGSAGVMAAKSGAP